MYRNILGAASALAILAFVAGTPAISFAHEGGKLCNVILDGDGEPVREADSDDIAHSNSSDCPSGAESRNVESGDNAQETAAVTTPAPAATVDPLTVYFDVSQDSLDAGASAEVDAYVAELMATSPTSLSVVGFTDTSGPADVNAQLSEARANSVAAALIEAGVPAGMITRGASGEDSLAIETPDNTREASNRRVTVTPAY
ncbi:MAG: OmpA family protein [Alphaproteobacteria bacterium]|nr:OmpA family protein [Alphaproteobacteria bacterium]